MGDIALVEIFQGEWGDPIVFPVNTTKNIITGMTPALLINQDVDGTQEFVKKLSGDDLSLSEQDVDGTTYQCFVWTPSADPDLEPRIYDVIGTVTYTGETNQRRVGYWRMQILQVAESS